MSYTVGSLVRVRGREWVVLPESTDDLLIVRPLGGTDDEVTGILTLLEPVTEATTGQRPCCARLYVSVFGQVLAHFARLPVSMWSRARISLSRC
jgi:hypothetical protein